MDALSIRYSGESGGTMWIEGSVLTLNLDSEVEFDLADTTIGELSAALNLVEGVNSRPLSDPDISASELNEISMDYPADIRAQTYFLGHGNYSSPKKVSLLSQRSANDIRNSWLDEADAMIESATGLVFRAKSIENATIDIAYRDTFSAEDYGVHCLPNGLYLRRYAPIYSVGMLKIDGVSVTASTVIADYDRLILTSSSEVKSWPVGLSKAEVSLSYGYPKGSRESVLASDFATLYTLGKLKDFDLATRKNQGATKITHGSVVFENDTDSEEAISRKEIELRMEMILDLLPKAFRRAIG